MAKREDDRVAAPPTPRTIGQSVAAPFLQYGMVWALILLIIVGTSAYPRLLDLINIRNILSQMRRSASSRSA